MELIGFFQVFIIITVTIMTLFHMRKPERNGSDDGSSPPTLQVMQIPPLREKYDVFLSFRGEDTRLTFTSHLHAALLRKKIETYIDCRLERGGEIGPALLEAIEKSTLSVIIFSKDYASSTWCLSELAHILECKEKHGQLVVPIFYDISPSDVRFQKGSYADAFAKHEQRFKNTTEGVTKLQKWRAALTTAANLSGFDISNKTRLESDIVETVVKDVLTKLNRQTSIDLKGLFGVESSIKEIQSLLCIDSTDIFHVAIWGLGGIGKTTLADAVFHHLSSKFEACCFLSNVRVKSEERDGLVHLRNKLFREILNEPNLNISTPSIGSDQIRIRLSRMKVLIVLDDVNDSRQIERLAGDHVQFGPGSRIIITTRDRSILKKQVEDNKIYKVKGLKHDEALQLFHHLNAFKSNTPRADQYTELAEKVVDYAGGIPLVLQILGSSFFHCKNKEDWQDVLKGFPRKIQKVLRPSYDALEDNEKEMFLDIACFYQPDQDSCYGRTMFDYVCGFHGAVIRVLSDKCLISISRSYCLEMHNVLQEMGTTIFQEERIEDPGKRSRLFINEDVNHVLKNNSGTATVQAIFFNRSEIGDLHLNHIADFQKMYNLRFLYVHNCSCDEYCNLSVSLPNSLSYLYWSGYPLKSLPSEFSPENLVELRMSHSKVEQLWNEQGQNLKNLKVMNLDFSSYLIKVPDLSQSQKMVHISLNSCASLVEIPLYFQYLDKLTYLNLGGCTKLKYIPEMPSSIEYLFLQSTAIEELPASVWSHEKIFSLAIHSCEDLKNLPSNSCKLKVSGTLSLKGCSSLGKLSELPRNITVLDLSGTAIQVLPTSSIWLCRSGLVEIKLDNCKRFARIPVSICDMRSLERLDLSGTAIENIPEGIKHVSRLRWLWLTNCKSLKSLPELPGVHCLEAHGCTSLKRVSNSQTGLTQGWGGYKHFRELQEHLKFSNCSKLGMVAWQNIMADAQLRIMRMAISLPKYFQEEEIEVASDDLELDEESNEYFVRSLVSIICPGKEIPNWFHCQREGSSISVKLPPNFFGSDFLGFAHSVVVAFRNYNVKGSLRLGCTSNFITNDGSCLYHRSCVVADYGEFNEDCNLNSDHMFVWYSPFDHVREGNYNGVTEASFDFYPIYRRLGGSIDSSNIKVTKCGISALYAPDARRLKLKLRTLRKQSVKARGIFPFLVNDMFLRAEKHAPIESYVQTNHGDENLPVIPTPLVLPKNAILAWLAFSLRELQSE